MPPPPPPTIHEEEPDAQQQQQQSNDGDERERDLEHIHHMLAAQMEHMQALEWLPPLQSKPGGANKTRLKNLATAKEQLPVLRNEAAALRAVASLLPPARDGVAALLAAVSHLEDLVTLTADMCDVHIGAAAATATARVVAGSGGAGSGARGVFADSRLCRAMLQYVGHGHWLYIAPACRNLRAAYMTVLATMAATGGGGGGGVQWMFKTRARAAFASIRTLAQARALELPPALLAQHSSVCTAAVGAARSPALVTAAVAAGLPLCANMLRGAASDANAALLEEMARAMTLGGSGGGRGGAGKASLPLDVWLRVGLDIVLGNGSSSINSRRPAGSGSGSGGARCTEALTWLSQQVQPREAWPGWYPAGLACAAAGCGATTALRWLLTSGACLLGPVEPATCAADFGEGPAADAHRAAFVGGAAFQLVPGSRTHMLNVLDSAIVHGRGDIVRWLRTERRAGALTPPAYADTTAAAGAAAAVAFTPLTASLAAARGNVVLLRYLRAVKCPFHMPAGLATTFKLANAAVATAPMVEVRHAHQAPDAVSIAAAAGEAGQQECSHADGARKPAESGTATATAAAVVTGSSSAAPSSIGG